MIYTSLAIGTLSLLSKKIADLIVRGWFRVGSILGYVNSRILLSVIFFVVLTPIALLKRTLTGSGLNLKKEHLSYFKKRDHLFEKSDFEKPW